MSRKKRELCRYPAPPEGADLWLLIPVRREFHQDRSDLARRAALLQAIQDGTGKPF
jgi:hypothetical protein